MTEAELQAKWEEEVPVYSEWADIILSEVSNKIELQGKTLTQFFKIPLNKRLKSAQSLIDKAFYRNKSYSDPYVEIEDKVGVRFVVLLLEDIKIISDVIEGSEVWSFDACKNFNDDKEREPLLFTYQSVHYILRPVKTIRSNGINVTPNTPCEVQIRTLLQHAHAELTHDAIYKAKKTVKPSVHRTVAKSMALIETTDEYFSSATKELNFGPLEEHSIIERLDALYQSFTGNKSHNQKSTLTIWDEFEAVISDELVQDIQDRLISNPEYKFLSDVIVKGYSEHALYQQSTVLFLYWMLLFKKRRLLNDWPFSKDLIAVLASDLGVSIEE